MMILSKMTLCLHAECRCAECRDLFIVMLNVIMLIVIMLNVVAPVEVCGWTKEMDIVLYTHSEPG
jgi:hypothetical protein